MQCPQALEERQPLSTSIGASSALSTGLLVDTNLDTSTPDTYQSPPAPMPYDTDLGRPPTPPGSTLGNSENKIDGATRTPDSESLGGTISGSAFETCSPKEMDCKNQADSVPPSPKKSDEPAKLSNLIGSPTEEEDVCPTCFEGKVIPIFLQTILLFLVNLLIPLYMAFFCSAAYKFKDKVYVIYFIIPSLEFYPFNCPYLV